jgi:F0F1-type ATP synthase assembly protein I
VVGLLLVILCWDRGRDPLSLLLGPMAFLLLDFSFLWLCILLRTHNPPKKKRNNIYKNPKKYKNITKTPKKSKNSGKKRK